MTSDSRSVGSWGPIDALGLWVLQFVGSAFWVVLLVSALYGGETPDPVPLGLLVAGQLVLWVAYGIGPIVVTKRKGNGPRRDLGAAITRWDLPIGAVFGALVQVVALPVLYWPILRVFDADPGATAEQLVDQADSVVAVALLTLLVVIAAPLVEELFFRGLVLHSLLRRIGRWPAIVVSSLAFAFVHLDPILFPGTFLIGFVAAVATVRTGRLGLAWGLHFGFNAATLVMLLLDVALFNF